MRQFAAIGLLTLLPLLGGCAAAMLAPAVLAGGAMTTAGERDARARAEAAEAAAPPAGQPALLSIPYALPAPRRAAAATDPWQEFADYALSRRGKLGGLDPVESALLVNPPTLEKPDRLPCRAVTPAVMIDLDAERTAFSPDSAAQPAPGLAEALARLRQAGVVVMWISQAEANRVSEIGEALRRSGLDPVGRDPLLLVRAPDERKQLMREDAGKSVCVLAIAGDRRGDFDELFDYLRVPGRAAGLDAMLGDGWFLTPLPLAPVAPTP